MGKEPKIVTHNTQKNLSNATRVLTLRVRETAEQKILAVFDSIKRRGYSTARPFSVGHVERRMRDFAKANNIEIAEGDMYMSVKGLTHARRGTKIRDGIDVSEKDLAEFPSKRNQMDLFYDGSKFIYTDYKNKFIIHPNYTLRMESGKIKKVNFITAGKVKDVKDFNNTRYIKV